MTRRIALLAALMLLCSLIPGCWNYRETESLAIVAGFGVDPGTEGHKYRLTLDIADTSSAGKDKPVVTNLLETEGDSLFEAVRNATKRTGLRLYWANCQVVVLNEAVASESILPVIDYLLRDIEPRLTIEVFVARQHTAKEILSAQASTMTISSFEIDKIYEMNEQLQPVSMYQTMYQIYNTLASRGRSLALPALTLTQNAETKTSSLDGTAVFRQDRLQGFLSSEDTKYFLFAADHVKGGTLLVRAPTGNVIATLEIFSNRTTMKTRVEGGKVRLSISTVTDTSVNAQDTDQDMEAIGRRNDIQALAESQLRDSIMAVIKLMQQQYATDIFGFGDALHRSDPGAWYALEKDWNGTFSAAEVEVSCRINIRDTGSINQPVPGGK